MYGVKGVPFQNTTALHIMAQLWSIFPVVTHYTRSNSTGVNTQRGKPGKTLPKSAHGQPVAAFSTLSNSTTHHKVFNMSIVSTIGFCSFCDAFRDMDRNENFSYQGKRALFDYLEQYSEDSGQPVELDVISLCCDYYENDTETIISECRIDINTDGFEDMDEDEIEESKTDQVREYLNEHTIVVGEVPGGFVYAAF